MRRCTTIVPNAPWWRIDWRELWEYRDLLWIMVRRDLSAVYRQSVLGPVWHILNPLLTTVLFTLVFGRIAGIRTDGIPQFLFYLCGTVFWNYNVACFNYVGGCLIGNARMFGKVYFPRLTVPLSLVISSLAQFGLSFGVLLVAIAVYRFRGVLPQDPGPRAWLTPLLVLQTGAVGLGAGLWTAALTVKYRDIRFLLPFLTQVWMYASPLVYPLGLIPAQQRWIAELNPMTLVIECSRLWFLGAGTVTPSLALTGVASALLLLVGGLLVFSRVERTFVDVV